MLVWHKTKEMKNFRDHALDDEYSLKCYDNLNYEGKIAIFRGLSKYPVLLYLVYSFALDQWRPSVFQGIH